MVQHIKVKLCGVIVVLAIESILVFFSNYNMCFVALQVAKQLKKFSPYFGVVATGMNKPAYICCNRRNGIV